MGLITIAGSYLPSSSVEAYVCPADIVTNRVNVLFMNFDGAIRKGQLWIVPNGASIADEHMVIGMESPNAKLRIGEPRPYPFNQVLSAGDKIFWAADAVDVVVGKLDISEAPAAGVDFDGFVRTYSHNTANTGYMPDALTLAYTVPSDPAKQIIQGELLVHNKSGVRQAFTVRAVPPGQSEEDINYTISSNTLQFEVKSGECRAYPMEFFLTAGYRIYWRAVNASVLVARMSFEEVQF